MAAYDFETVYPRTGVGSEKWDAALAEGMPPDSVPLTVADMEFRSAPVIMEALRETAAYGMWGYTYDEPEFKAAILSWMERHHGFRGKAEWMVHTGGVVQALYVAVRALTAPGDGVLIQPPVYHPFYHAVERCGRRVVENPLKRVNGRYEMDLEDLKAKLPGAKMMILCSPHNPVGRVWAAEEIGEVARLCRLAGIPLFSDEIHCDIVLPPHRHFSAGRLEDELLENCLIGTSASKTFSLAGLACSTTFVPGAALREKMEVRLERDGYGFNTTFGVAATRAAYRGAEDWLKAFLVHLAGNYQLLRETLGARLPKLVVYPLEGTYLAWVDFSALGLGGDALVDFLHNSAQLWLNDGRMFRTGGEGFARFNLACPRSVLQQALDRLCAAAEGQGLGKHH